MRSTSDNRLGVRVVPGPTAYARFAFLPTLFLIMSVFFDSTSSVFGEASACPLPVSAVPVASNHTRSLLDKCHWRLVIT
nr:hypothetical protein CFP56_62534 [Quercus suber]